MVLLTNDSEQAAEIGRRQEKQLSSIDIVILSTDSTINAIKRYRGKGALKMYCD
jgi:hypothetical protein